MQILSKVSEGLNIFHSYAPFYLHAYLFPCRTLEDQKQYQFEKEKNCSAKEKARGCSSIELEIKVK